jgi:hypothetical protein
MMSLILQPLLLGSLVCSWVFVCWADLGCIFFSHRLLVLLLLGLCSLLGLCLLWVLCFLLEVCLLWVLCFLLEVCLLLDLCTLLDLCCFLWIAFSLLQLAFVHQFGRLVGQVVLKQQDELLEQVLGLGLRVELAFLQQLGVVERRQVELPALAPQP